MKGGYASEIIKTVKCPICGKEFIPAPYHAYKIYQKGYKLVCTYGCMRKWERQEENKNKKQQRRKKL
ncbi:MAG: hypothetical protein IJ470_03700 [Clostridia bacterium]|nr:hypothetical protein [Clostridia bacterium]